MGKWTTLEQKQAIVKEHHKRPDMTQAELAVWAKKTFKMAKAPAQTTISDILKRGREGAWTSAATKKRTKSLKVTSPRLERDLGQWVAKMEAKQIRLSRGLITTKAERMQVRLGGDALNVDLSTGWMTRFMRRHGLRFRQLHGESGSVDPAVVAAGRRSLHEFLEDYEPSDVFNMDETGLCYAMAPARSICTPKMKGKKKKKTRITVALAANATGSSKLPPLFIGRAKKPRCFGKKTASQLGFQYANNAKAWMTGGVFRPWLLRVDREMRAANRKVVLLLDNASSHGAENILLANVKVHMLPPNTTAFLQPMDAGIIAAMKCAYKKKQMERALDLVEQNEDYVGDVYAVDQLQAMMWTDEVWRDLSSKTIANAFRHTSIMFPQRYDDPDEDPKDLRDSRVEDLADALGRLSIDD